MSGALHLEKNCKFSSPRRISLILELEDDQDVTLQNERSLRDASWTIQFIEIKSFDQPSDLEESIGQLSYLPKIESDFDDSNEACHAIINLDEENFSFLLSYMQSGRLPDSISIQVDKLEYGWDPDGKIKVWDVDSNPHVQVFEINIRMPVISLSNS